jgi:hypothetical protein
VDAWIEETEPVALGLLGLKPWEFDRCTPGEVEAMLAGVAYRHELLWDILARHALRTGMWSQDARPSLSDVIGREPKPYDPRWQPKPSDEDDAEERHEHDLVEDSMTLAREYESLGMAQTGRLTPEELARARDEARVR